MSEEAKRSPATVPFPSKPPFTAEHRKLATASPLSTSTSGSKNVVIKSADMKEEMQTEAIDIAIAAFEKSGVEKDIAEQIKKEFDKNHGPTWHCIVGKNFGQKVMPVNQIAAIIFFYFEKKTRHGSGSYVTHETNHFVYFYFASKAILLFKSG